MLPSIPIDFEIYVVAAIVEATPIPPNLKTAKQSDIMKAEPILKSKQNSNP
jgi:hypothetical protein